jgi:hypothetical protein
MRKDLEPEILAANPETRIHHNPNPQPEILTAKPETRIPNNPETETARVGHDEIDKEFFAAHVYDTRCVYIRV